MVWGLSKQNRRVELFLFISVEQRGEEKKYSCRFYLCSQTCCKTLSEKFMIYSLVC